VQRTRLACWRARPALADFVVFLMAYERRGTKDCFGATPLQRMRSNGQAFQPTCGTRALPYFSACAFSSSSVTNSRAEEWVASRSTGAARLWSNALFQRVAHTHHLSPGFNPGKPHSGRGVIRSLPSSTEKSKNSSVTCTQTLCCPASSGPVRQKPSR